MRNAPASVISVCAKLIVKAFKLHAPPTRKALEILIVNPNQNVSVFAVSAWVHLKFRHFAYWFPVHLLLQIPPLTRRSTATPLKRGALPKRYVANLHAFSGCVLRRNKLPFALYSSNSTPGSSASLARRTWDTPGNYKHDTREHPNLSRLRLLGRAIAT